MISDGHLVITTEEAAVHRQLKQRIEVNYDNVPLQTAVKELSSKHGVSVVFDPKTVKTKTAQNLVTLQVDDVPFEAAIRLMCEMADLKPARMGNVIYITSEARADKLKDSDTLVPAPKMINPNMPFVPGGFGGFAGNIGGVAMPAQLIPARPPASIRCRRQKKRLPRKTPRRPRMPPNPFGNRQGVLRRSLITPGGASSSRNRRVAVSAPPSVPPGISHRSSLFSTP